ncbi:MAG: hypothetical protein HUU06_11575 [Planctomycetaceae bacterium]|nr:hypothetical protein [Planctomycetaceae bacterium]
MRIATGGFTGRVLGLGVVAAALLAPPAAVRADDKSPSAKFHEDKLVGFRFRPLSDWAAVPPGTDPNDPKIGGYYSDAAKYDRTIKPELEIYAFKVQREEVATEGGGGEEGGKEKRPQDLTPQDARDMFREQFGAKSTRDRVRAMMDEKYQIAEQLYASWPEKLQKKNKSLLARKDPVEKELKAGDGVLTLLDADCVVAITNGEIWEFKIVAGFIQNDEYEVGVIYQIPGDQWKRYSQGVVASLRSMEFMDGAEVADARKDLADALSGAKTDDERWLEAIKRKVGPGWAHLQTKNYLLVYDKAVKPDRVKLIAKQIEAIRLDVYEQMFPADRPVTAISVVRVCKDRDQYGQYGGPGGSAGYWNSAEQELVFFEDTSAKKDALRVLNHEAFHQYIFYSVGSISPHDWFNEGHGDYFSGHDFGGTGKFVAKPFSWRQGIIKGAMGSKSYIPLKTFVTYSHQQYYGPQIGQNYAQGWSLIWFLRRTKNPAWQGILEKYFNTLKSEVTKWVDEQIAEQKKSGEYKEGWKPAFTPDDVEENARKKALDAAFGSFDDKTWQRFEKEWLDFKY